jgi:glycosyltransferase EpsH
MIKVSIIVPVYNVEKYIDKCLKSLVNQTLKEIEIIVINDGSPDNSQKIIDKYVKKYPTKVKSFITENGGQGSARNFGIQKAQGEYILYVDSDDYIELNMAELLYKEAKNKDADIVICGNNIIEDETYNLIKSESSYSFNDKKDKICNFIFGKMAVWNKIYKKDLIINNDINFRSRVWYEDVDFSVKAYFQASNITYLDIPLYNYLLREGSTMNNQNVKRNLELCASFDEVINYCKEKDIYNDNYSEIEFLCLYHMYICGITRIINIKANSKIKKKTIKKYRLYIKDNFKDYKNNKYIKYLDKNKRLVYNLINFKCYGLIKYMFKIKERLSK